MRTRVQVPFAWRELAAALALFSLCAGLLLTTALLCGGGQ